jgi:hypothetical protein
MASTNTKAQIRFFPKFNQALFRSFQAFLRRIFGSGFLFLEISIPWLMSSKEALNE